MKKLLSFILIITIALSVFASCTGVDIDMNESSAENSKAPSASTTDSSEADASVDNDSSASVDANSSSEVDDSSVADTSDNPYKPADGEFSFPNGLIILGDRCMESFGGSYDNANLYKQYVVKHKEDLGANVNIYSMVVPTASSIYLQGVVRDGVDYYEKYGGNQVDKLKYLDEQFANTGVVSVNVYDTLFSHWDEDIYFRTDWHWTQLGAYYAAEKFASVAGLSFKTLDSGYYTKNGKYNEDGTFKPFIGTFYASTGYSSVLKDNPEEFFWYDFNHEYTVEYYDRETGTKLKATRDTCNLYINDKAVSSWYMTFLDADNNLCKINTGTKNGKTAVVFKDSFGNCFAPMLMSMYETVYVIDFRKFTGNSVDFCKNVGATDVIFALSSFSAMGPNCLEIGKMRLR